MSVLSWSMTEGSQSLRARQSCGFGRRSSCQQHRRLWMECRVRERGGGERERGERVIITEIPVSHAPMGDKYLLGLVLGVIGWDVVLPETSMEYHEYWVLSDIWMHKMSILMLGRRNNNQNSFQLLAKTTSGQSTSHTSHNSAVFCLRHTPL